MKTNQDISEMISNYSDNITNKLFGAQHLVLNGKKELARQKLQTVKSLTETMIKKFEDAES